MAAQDDPERNETFDALTDPYRRYVLHYLSTESEVVRLETLAGALADWEEDHPTAEHHGGAASIEFELHHVHLPKLVDIGVITFDSDTGIVELDEANGHDKSTAEAVHVDGHN